MIFFIILYEELTYSFSFRIYQSNNLKILFLRRKHRLLYLIYKQIRIFPLLEYFLYLLIKI
ncbi:unnamed protein product [Paramecium octaurelia]|uniref:Uncharacterized protein n=1 Tax=Paramecium octaurelia TaxID=43137 RepID=A0A8S1WB95_PAROT|nr:unnamed protein product [Paramecium octaurelia]